jgi:hypothetical protein
MDMTYNQANVFGITCLPGQSVRVPFNSELNFVTDSNQAAYILDVRLDADGQVTIRQDEKSTANGLWLGPQGAPRRGLPVRFEVGKPTCITQILGIRSGRIYTHEGCAYLLLTGDRLADGSAQYTMKWKSLDAFGETETLDVALLRSQNVGNRGVVDFNQRRLQLGRR